MPEKVFIDSEGEQIVGVFHEGDEDLDACVISCHGLLATKDSVKYITLAEKLNKIGIPSFRFDFRGCGESEGKLINSHITNRTKDLKGVIEYVSHELGYKKLGLFGSSMGGFISFIQASTDTKIKAFVSLSSPYSMAELFEAHGFNNDYYEIDGVVFGSEFIKDVKTNGDLTPEILCKIKCPVHIFHGSFDLLVPTEHAKRLFEGIKAEKKLKIINGGDHMFSHPYHLVEIIETSKKWYSKYLLGA
jgi:pimeloyl-ACP methyl ester carboxylesterase